MPKRSDHQLCTNTAESGDPSDAYKLRAALEGTFVFSAKIDMAQKLTYLLAILQLAERLCQFKLYRNSVQGDTVDSKSYCTNAHKPIAIRPAK